MPVLRNLTKLLICALFFAPLAAAEAWADGTVYAMTNAIGNNQILVWHRASDGTLNLIQTIATRGGGSGAQLDPADSLGSQGSLVLDKAHHLLFAVNTESLAENDQDCQQGTVTAFLVTSNGKFRFADRVKSGGLFPNSLAVKTLDDRGNYGDLLYVLNAGGPGSSPFCGPNPNITGFTANSFGQMSLLRNSVQSIIDPGPLNGTGTGVNRPVPGLPTPSYDCGRNPPAFVRSPARVS